MPLELHDELKGASRRPADRYDDPSPQCAHHDMDLEDWEDDWWDLFEEES